MTERDLLSEAIDLIGRLEFSVQTFERTGSDTYECPECGGSQIRGLRGEHAKDCVLKAFLDKAELWFDATQAGPSTNASPDSPDINPLIDALRSRMITMTDEERLDVRRSIMEGYCEECGSKHLPCYCTRDD